MGINKLKIGALYDNGLDKTEMFYYFIYQIFIFLQLLDYNMLTRTFREYYTKLIFNKTFIVFFFGWISIFNRQLFHVHCLYDMLRNFQSFRDFPVFYFHEGKICNTFQSSAGIADAISAYTILDCYSFFYSVFTLVVTRFGYVTMGLVILLYIPPTSQYEVKSSGSTQHSVVYLYRLSYLLCSQCQV